MATTKTVNGKRSTVDRLQKPACIRGTEIDGSLRSSVDRLRSTVRFGVGDDRLPISSYSIMSWKKLSWQFTRDDREKLQSR